LESFFYQQYYTGLDFSESLIRKNKDAFPDATFVQLTAPDNLPFPDNTFNMVFSVFVIEHTVFPHKFLSENLRVLKQGGTFCLLCPDFLGNGRITSQRVGLSPGTGRHKLEKGEYLDAFLTGFDSKIRMPLFSMIYRLKSFSSPQFFINCQPTCFVDPFKVDLDAVYLTYNYEIKSYLNICMQWVKLSKELSKYCNLNNLIYLKGIKK